MKRILAVVEYDGTAYQGWQKQINGQTIQNQIEKVLSKILNCPIAIYGSGRTDAGVHALGQTFHFDVEKKIEDLKLFKHSINCLLQKDIRIKSLKYVNHNFHARLNAKSKTYMYLFSLNELSAFNYPFICDVHGELNFELFKRCLNLFVGRHNFINYTSKEEDELGYVRTIHNISIKHTKNIYRIDFQGDGFMRYMIRFIVGTCLACGLGKTSFEDIKRSLIDFSMKFAPIKAPAKGLFLVKVKY